MKLYRNLSWMFFANFFVAFSKWAVIILLAKITTPEDVGVYSLAFAVSAPIILFSNMKLRSLYVTSQEKKLDSFFIARRYLNYISIVVLFIIGILVYPEYLFEIMLIGLGKTLDLQSDMYYAVPHRKSDLKIVGKIMILKQILLLIVFSSTLYISKDLIISLTLQFLMQIVLVLAEGNYISKKYLFIKTNIVFKEVKNVIILGMPLGIVQMMTSFNTNYPRYILEFVESAEILGYFSAIMYIAIIANVFTNAMSQVFLPVLSDLFKKKEFEKFYKYVNNYVFIGSLLLGAFFVMFVVMFGEYILTVFYGDEYAEYKNLLIVVAIYSSINLLISNFDNALIAMNYIKILPKITFFTFFITVIGGYYLISQYYIYGAGLILLVSASIQLLLKWYFTNIRLKIIKAS